MKKGSNTTCHVVFAGQQEIEAQLKEECQQFQQLEKEASWRALRIGVLLLRVKAELKHGEFLPWMESTVPEFTQRHCQRFMQLGDAFLRKTKIKIEDALPLVTPKLLKPSDGKGEKLSKYVQMAFEFLGDSSLTDLFKKYHIMGAAKGGHHPADPNKIKLPHDPEKEAITSWKEFSKILYDDGVQHKTWANLPNKELCNLFDLIDLIHSQMREAVKRIKTIKK